MLRVERDPAFWAGIAGHVEVAPHIGAGPAEVAAFARRADVVPMAAEHGGFLFRNLDGLGFVFELHTLFTPEGWGREVVEAAHRAFALMFDGGAAIIVTHEQADQKRSRPPLSHGWAPSADWRRTALGRFRMWALSADGWRSSPAVRRRMH